MTDYRSIQASLAQEGQAFTPPDLLEEKIDEGKEYAKELVQGSGSLLLGESALKGYNALKNSSSVIKKLGFTDEEIGSLKDAILAGDKGKVLEQLTNKGVQLTKKGIERVIPTFKEKQTSIESYLRERQRRTIQRVVESQKQDNSMLNDDDEDLLTQARNFIPKRPVLSDLVRLPDAPQFTSEDFLSAQQTARGLVSKELPPPKSILRQQVEIRADDPTNTPVSQDPEIPKTPEFIEPDDLYPDAEIQAQLTADPANSITVKNEILARKSISTDKPDLTDFSGRNARVLERSQLEDALNKRRLGLPENKDALNLEKDTGGRVLNPSDADASQAFTRAGTALKVNPLSEQASSGLPDIGTLQTI